MTEPKKIKDALEVIREECLSNDNCEECPFYKPTTSDSEEETNCYLSFYAPCSWEKLKVGGDSDGERV